MERTPDIALTFGQDPWHLHKQVTRCQSELLEMKDKVGALDGLSPSDHDVLETVAAHLENYRVWTERQVDKTFVRIDLDRKLSRLDDRVAQVDRRLDYVGVRLDSHDERFDDLDKQLHEIRQLVLALGSDSRNPASG